MKVKVTNTGAVAGKVVVELYDTAPYTPGGIEKSAVELGAFAKTKLLAPGESQELELTLAVADMASYDCCYDANANGFTGYELDAGEYVLSLRRASKNIVYMALNALALRGVILDVKVKRSTKKAQ